MNARSFGSFALVVVVLVSLGEAADPPAGGFDALVPPVEVRKALLSLDPEALATIAAKTAVAEKTLGQPRPGLTAAQMYEATIRVAGERRALTVLTRLAADGSVKSDPRLASLVAATRLAASASRNPDPELRVALDQISPEQFALFRAYLTQMQDAKALADHDALNALEHHVSATQDLSQAQRQYLAKVIGKTRSVMPSKPPAAAVAVKQAREEAARQEKKVEASTPPAPKTTDTGPPTTNTKGGGTGQSSTLTARLTGDTSALIDDGFEGRIDLAKIGKAWGQGDAIALTDSAFLMADAERVLGRPHRHVPAKVLFQASFGLAIANGDQTTLARIEKGLTGEQAPAFEGKDDFLVKLTKSKSLVAMSRKGHQPFLTSIEDTSPESFRVFRSFLDRIRGAGTKRDLGMLAGLAEGLDTVVELDDSQRAYLAREVTEVRKASPGQPDAATGVLRKLEGDTQAMGLPALNREVLKFCRDRVGQKVETGECSLLAVRAFDQALAKQPPAASPEADPIWGRLVKPAESLPGDVIQFRDVRLEVVFPDDHTQSWTYTRHTAVISSVEGPGRFTILQQDIGPAGKSPDKKKIVQVGFVDIANVKAGTISIYRPLPR